MSTVFKYLGFAGWLALSAPSATAAPEVQIAPGVASVETVHAGKTVTIERNPNPDNTVNPLYAKTSRSCPPFCIQPMQIAEGVETVGELEVLDYLRQINSGDTSVLVVDSRTPDWLARGTIPGSVNVPWSLINPNMYSPLDVSEFKQFDEVMSERFGAVKQADGKWDFSAAKTLVLFCNGMWCPQSGLNIKTLVKYGYPPQKLKWYRGGMQDWEILGLTTLKAE